MSDAPARIWVHVGTGEVSIEKPERHWEFQDFDTIQSAMTAARIEGAQMADRIEELEAKLAKAVEALGDWTVLLDHCSIEEGVCCCGEDMEGHSHPMNCGHSPVDHGAYVATNLYERTRAALTEINGGGDD